MRLSGESGVGGGAVISVNGLRNIKMVLAYDGTNYRGWQKQKKQVTIQGVLEEKIARMTGEKRPLYGAGRTDAGVHALGMAANFHTGSTIPCLGFLKGLNSLLPPDIRVLHVSEQSSDFHARYSALAKKYAYFISLADVHLPTERFYSAHVVGGFDLAALRACLACLEGRHDFASFEAAGSRTCAEQQDRGATRRIFSAKLVQAEDLPTKISIEIIGDGFLRHMVRNIVGTLIEVGYGKRTVDGFRQVMAAGCRSAAGPTAPARGLFLMEVYYRAFI